MRYPGHSPSCPTRLAHTDPDRHPIRMQSWPAHVEQPPRDDRGIEIGCWRWAVGEPMPGFRLVPAACDHLVAWIRQESSRIRHLWRLTDSEVPSLFRGLAYPCNKVAASENSFSGRVVMYPPVSARHSARTKARSSTLPCARRMLLGQ